jgi:hypothetical protein
MLVRLRIAEIGEHAVAHVLGDKPAIALDEVGAAAMVAADDPTQILGSSWEESAVEPTKS